MNNAAQPIEGRVKDILLNSGCLSILNNESETLSFDSIEFVNLIVELEQEFSICIPDEYLAPEAFSTYKAICNIVANLIEEQNCVESNNA